MSSTPTTDTPTVAFVGPGGCGKDAAAEILGQFTTLRYAGSTSWAGLPYVAKRLNVAPMLAWERRRENRERWKALLDEFREHDPAVLTRLCLKEGEVFTGIRDKVELEAARHLITHVVWLHRPETPTDPTLTFGPVDCDVVLPNDKPGLFALRRTLKRWAKTVGLPFKAAPVSQS